MGTSAEAAELAAAYGVATSYRDADGRRHEVPATTVVDVLRSLGVAPGARRGVPVGLPPTLVSRAGRPRQVAVSPAGEARTAGAGPAVRVLLEDGGELPCRAVAPGVLELPALPAGWHTVLAEEDGRTLRSTLVTAPDRILAPAGGRRIWGWMIQLYALHSRRSWGLGDYADLAELARWCGAEVGAGVVVCNPLAAPRLLPVVEDSPYLPSSRRHHDPVSLRVEATPEYGAAADDVRLEVGRLRPGNGGLLDGDGLIDRQAVWRAKAAALQLLFDGLDPARRERRIAALRDREGGDTERFALFCALAERHPGPWRSWPRALRSPDGPGIAAERRALRDRIDFHLWLQVLCEEQLEAAGEAARSSGMSLGIVHDVPVGVDPDGADAWCDGDVLVADMSVGAPPDGFNQLGQDWGLPPWNPLRLAEEGYAPLRRVVRAALCGAAGVRIDHVLGLFRLWWVPRGRPASEGTYVRYDHEAMLSVVALEAWRAGAVVVGEDLGTVEPHVARALDERGVLGSDVLWFARDEPDAGRGPDAGGGPDVGGEPEPDAGPGAVRIRPPGRWRAAGAASVTTHDLPTATGFLTGEHVRLRARLGLLGRPEDAEAAHAAAERAAVLDALRREGLLPEHEDSLPDLVAALYAYLARTPCLLALATPGDAVGDLRQPNLPASGDRYPNWRLPLAVPDGDGARPVGLEEFFASPQVRRIAAALGSRGSAPQA